MKIGVLTFHRCINYGSYWQARCLVEGLRVRGHDAVLLDHDDPHVRYAEWRCAFQPLLPVRTAREDLHAYAVKTRRFLEAFDALPQSHRFALDRPEDAGEYDLVLVGSDEVWNFSHPWYGGKPIFFGEGLRTKRLASYAASFGNHDAASGMAAEYAERLARFDTIAVRDDNGRRLVRDATGREPALVLDPCLQFPPVFPPANEPNPYLLVYGHGFPDWFGPAVSRWAADNACRTISVGYRNDWVDEQRLDAGPLDFAALMTGASAVATNFFHGCVFALLNAKPFVCAYTPYRFNKVRDLTAKLGAEHHVVTDGTAPERYAELLGQPLVEPAVGERIKALRAQGDAYLASLLG